MDVAARLIALREARGYTTNRLANLAGVSQSFVRDIERRAKRPTVETLSLLCDALGVSLRDFFDEPGPPPGEDALLRRIRRLTPRQQEAQLHFLDALER